MYVALDLDHCVVDLASQARAVLAADLGVPVDEIYETYVYHTCFAHADPEINARISLDHSFWEREEIMAGAHPMPGAVDAVWRIHKAGRLRAFVTRRSPTLASVTLNWLRRQRLPNVKAHFVGHNDPALAYAHCKTHACRASGATMMVDDSPAEIARVVDGGLGAILIDAPVGRAARHAFLAARPDILCLPSLVEVADHVCAI